MGVVGYGSIGREVGRLAKDFGMRLVATTVDPDKPADTGYVLPGTGDPEGVLPDVLEGPEWLMELLGQSDVVVLTVPSTPATFRMMGAAQFQAMRPSAMFVNMSRGTAVDEAADQACAGWIAGAAGRDRVGCLDSSGPGEPDPDSASPGWSPATMTG